VQVVSFTPPAMFRGWTAADMPAVTRSVLIGAVVSGAVAALAVPWTTPGIGWLVTGLVVTVAIVVAARSLGAPSRRVSLSRMLWGAAALVLLAAVGVLAAPWMGLICTVSAFGCAALAIAGERATRGMALAVVLPVVSALRALPWAARGTPDRGSGDIRRGGVGRLLAAVAVSVVLLVVFAALFAGADPVFAHVLSVISPTVDGATVTRWVFSLIVFVPGTLGACYAIVARRPDTVDDEPTRTWRRLEWALPVGTMVTVFAAFVAVQATVLFGGADHVLRTEDLTFAEYARSGFWQLLVVTVLTLLVMAVVARKAIRTTVTDRMWLRGLTGALAVLSLVVVASALGRMWTYEQAYGFSRLRVLVSACELWLGVVFLLVISAGVRLTTPARWLPQAVVGTGVAALLGLVALNPDRFIAAENVDWYTRTGTIDLSYLELLSVDAVPALDRLPEPQRSCALTWILGYEPSRPTGGLRAWTLDGHVAERVVADRPYTTGYSCPPAR
jgi:hypothetical protein